MLLTFLVATLAWANPDITCRSAYQDLSAVTPLAIPLRDEQGRPELNYHVGWGYDLRRYRGYGKDGSLQPFTAKVPAHLHTAIDLQAPAGTGVVLIRPARLVRTSTGPRGRFREATLEFNELSADGSATNRFWLYTHLRADSVPAEIWDASQTGRPLEAGTPVGAINAWDFSVNPGIPAQIDVSNGQPFDHLHLSLRVGDTFCNPMPLLAYSDREPPVVKELYFLNPGTQEVLPPERALGRAVDLAIEAFDLTSLATGGGAGPFRLHNLKLFELTVKSNAGAILYRNRWEAPLGLPTRASLTFNRWRFPLELDSDGKKLFMEGDVHGRRFFLRLNEKGAPVQIPAGAFTIYIRVQDFKGNVADYARSY